MARPRMFQKNKWHIVRGDLVEVIRGPHRGAQGKVLRVHRDKMRPSVVIDGVNMRKRTIQQADGAPYTIVSPRAIQYGWVNLVDPITKRAVRASYKFLEDGTKVRVGKGGWASGAVIPKPPEASERYVPRPAKAGSKDTPVAEVLKQTYVAGQPWGVSTPGDGAQEGSSGVGSVLGRLFGGRGYCSGACLVPPVSSSVSSAQQVQSSMEAALVARWQRQLVGARGSFALRGCCR